MWKFVISGAQIVGRALNRAIQQEINASQQAAKARSATSASDGKRQAASDALTGISVSEAKQVLNIDDIEDKERLKNNFDHLFGINEKAKGGSFYLQSKVYRAHERLLQELEDLEQNRLKKQKKMDQDS